MVALVLTSGQSLPVYFLAAITGTWAFAAVGAIDNETTNYDNTPGVVLVFTFLYMFAAALPAIFIVAAVRLAISFHRHS